jgi:membrane associated rhomboid family serine protease
MNGPERDPAAAGGAPVSAEQMIAEARKACFVMIGFLAVLWLVQLVNWGDGYALSREYAVSSRDVTRLPDILTAPFLHGSWAHIEANSGPLFVFGFLAAYRGVARFLALSLLVAVTSGLAVWLFQESSLTVGAGGLVFGYFGYVVVRGLVDRHLADTLIGIVMAASFAYVLASAVPGTPGVSWLGNLGGLVGGLAGAWLLRDRRRKAASPSGEADGDGPGQGSGASPQHARADLYKELGDLGLL